ncbi:hypothetical protein BC831DRAFT_509004 [Entophlyctis helioformis]|nr:hypothetical protein BC831DRAFT_509004 [Entophlyctis helioformis]
MTPLLPGSPADPPLTNIIVGPTFANASAPAQCFRFGQSFYVFEALPLSAASPTPASPAAPPTQQQPSAQVVPWKCNTGCPALLRDASAQCYSIAGLNKSCSVVPSSELPTLSDPTSVLFQVQDKLAGDYCFTRSILSSLAAWPQPDIGKHSDGWRTTSHCDCVCCTVLKPTILDQYFWMQPMNAFLFASDQCTTPLPGSP